MARIVHERRKKLQILASNGIIPGATVHVVERRPLGMVLYVAGRKCTLDHYVASSVLVKNMEDVKNARQKKAVT